MPKYPNEYHDFKSTYVELINTQRLIAKKFSQNANLKLHVFNIGKTPIVGYVPAGEPGSDSHLTVNANNYQECQLSKDAFLLVTTSIATGSLWQDIEFNHYEAFSTLMNLYILRKTPRDQRVNFKVLQDRFAKLHSVLTEACNSHKESSLINRLFD